MFLGIDIGTSGVKAVVLDEHGAVAAQGLAALTVQRPHPPEAAVKLTSVSLFGRVPRRIRRWTSIAPSRTPAACSTFANLAASQRDRTYPVALSVVSGP